MVPAAIHEFLRGRALQQGLPAPSQNEDLFSSGILDSFALVELVSIIEAEVGFKVPDGDVVPRHFQSINAIEKYLDTKSR